MKLKIFFITCLAILLCGCFPEPITMNQIQTIQRGYSVDQVNQLVKRKPTSEVTTVYKNKSYLAQFIPMQTGTTTQYTMSCTQYSCISTPISVPVSSPYVFLYRDDQGYKLLTWGFVQELNKSGDLTTQAVMQQIAQTTINTKS